MKFAKIIIATFFAAIVAAPVDQPLEFKAITSNVRNDAPPEKRFPHEKSWDERKVGQINTLKNESSQIPTVIGLQEILKNQLDDILAGLNNYQAGPWTHFGVGRDDGVEKGEYAAVVYSSDDWELVNGTYKWLSETPDVPSKSWGAANIRIVTITELRSKKTGKHINFLNTHYDYKSQEAREKSSEIIGQYIQQIPNQYPTYLTGDFNSIDTDLSYTTLVKYMSDTRLSSFTKYTQRPTFTGFEPEDHHSVIDFIWSPLSTNTENASTNAITYNVIDTVTPEGFRFSDHRPVVVTFSVV